MYLYDGRLALDAGGYGRLLDVDYKIPPLQVARHADLYLHVPDRLLPLVRQGVLLGLLLGARGGVLCGGGF